MSVYDGIVFTFKFCFLSIVIVGALLSLSPLYQWWMERRR